MVMELDIRHMKYFLAIVENDFNLTKTAEVLMISQPALSRLINDLESKESVLLFKRKKGRITGLTEAGKDFLEDITNVVMNYNHAVSRLRNRSKGMAGTIKIGIAPVILSVLFAEVIPQFIFDNPNVHLELVEEVAYDLQTQLARKEIDLAFLMAPATFSNITEKVIFSDTVSVFYNPEQPFAKSIKPVSMYDLSKEKLAILDESFMLHHQIMNRFDQQNLSPNVIFQTKSWDLLMNMCRLEQVLTILPRPIASIYHIPGIMHKSIYPKFPWKVSLCKMAAFEQDRLVQHTEEYFENYFAAHSGMINLR